MTLVQSECVRGKPIVLMGVSGDMSDNSFYKSKAWKRKRKAVLARDGYQCQIAKRYGKRVPAEVVHHIMPLDEYPQYRLESWNLISISAKTHNELHDRATGELTTKGKQLLERTAREHNIDYQSQP